MSLSSSWKVFSLRVARAYSVLTFAAAVASSQKPSPCICCSSDATDAASASGSVLARRAS
jgi:hypothetical protein